jgi:hypothetical protein
MNARNEKEKSKRMTAENTPTRKMTKQAREQRNR